MCKYADLASGKCKVNKEICPFLYYCSKTKAYKELNNSFESCKVKIQADAPKGFYRVKFERNKNLYILVGNKIEIVRNPYDYVPSYVKMNKNKSGEWRIKRAVR